MCLISYQTVLCGHVALQKKLSWLFSQSDALYCSFMGICVPHLAKNQAYPQTLLIQVDV